jgi:hypothetical protein
MAIDPHLSFVRERVLEIRSALFFNRAPAPLMLSAAIISAIELDEKGYIKFFISRPEYIVKEDKRFPAELAFYRQGKPYYMKVGGVAELVTDESEYRKYFEAFINPINNADRRLALVQLKVEHVEYGEQEKMLNYRFIDRIRSYLGGWFFNRDVQPG